MPRIAIVGTTGSGKTTLGERAAARLGCPFVDLDPLIWGPNWTLAPHEEVQVKVESALSVVAWVTAGNSSRLRPIIWARADTLVWLDYPLPIVLWRLLGRTLRRTLLREELWAGNRESFREQFFSRESLLLYSARTHPRRKREFPADLAKPEYAHLRVVHLRWPAEAERWLRELARSDQVGHNRCVSELRVFFPSPLTEAERPQLLPLLAEDIIVHEGPSLPDPAEFDVLVAGRPTRAQLAASPTLRALIIPWAGIPAETRELMGGFPTVIVHNLHHNAAPVAELALMLLLAAAKFALRYDSALRAGDWRIRYERSSPTVLLEGKTALVLGYGAIGRRVARACNALGMEVLATRRSAGLPARDEWAEVYPPAALQALLPRANALVICLPHTPQTDGLLGAPELALLPMPSVLVNIGRGPIIDETALYEALKTGRLAAAGLDVWYHYPPDETSRAQTQPSAYPFHELDNVIMSPHRGGASDETARLRMAALAELLNAAAAGQEMPNEVDLQAGY